MEDHRSGSNSEIDVGAPSYGTSYSHCAVSGPGQVLYDKNGQLVPLIDVDDREAMLRQLQMADFLCSEFHQDHQVSCHLSSRWLKWREDCSIGMSKLVCLCWKVNSIYGGKPYQLPRCFLSKNIRMSQTGLVHVCRARSRTAE